MAKIKKILNTPIRLALMVLLIGMVGRMLNWPFASVMIFIGFLAVAVLYDIRFYRKPVKTKVDYVKLFLVMFWSTNGILRILDFPFTGFFQVMTGITFVVWFIMEGTAYFLDNDRRSRNTLSQILWNCCLVLGTLGLIIGSLLSVLGWDLAMFPIVIGLMMITAYVAKDLFVSEKVADGDRHNDKIRL